MISPNPLPTRASSPSRAALRTELRLFVDACRIPRVRTLRQFAEAEIIPPTGPFRNLKFRCDRQPAAGIFFDLVDSGRWNEIWVTGPSQAGKSLMAFIIPLLYHLFEIKETVIVAIPQMKMAKDKWQQDILPIIEKTRYRTLLPLKGSGSRGGEFNSITFLNGATLRFMSGGGDDKNRASFTSRVVVITEADGLQDAGGSSEETDKIGQIRARTNAYGSQRRIYGECTLTTPQGKTFREISGGTATKLLVTCKSCRHLVSPDREDLIGWQEAENEIDAGTRSTFTCPDCGVLWSDADRLAMHRDLRCMHRGQEIEERPPAISHTDNRQLTTDNYHVVGDFPKTRTLGFRFNGFNNLLVTAADLGVEEWKAQRDVNPELAERKMCQFFWALPFIADKSDDVQLDALTLSTRTVSIPRGVIPPRTAFISTAIDVGKWKCHWVAIAWLMDGTCQVIDYGVISVDSATLGVERAVLKALREFRVIEEHGWANPDGSRRRADRVFVDSGYQTDEVYLFVRESGPGRYWAADGRGQSTRKASSYQHPKAIGGTCRLLGEQYHVSLQDNGILLLAMNADHWKSYAHKRLSTPPSTPGSMMLFAPVRGETHLEWAKQLCAEKKTEEFQVGKGMIEKWVKTHRNNHYLDATYMACVAGHLAGFRLIATPTAIMLPVQPPPVARIEIPETSRPYVRQPARTRSDENQGGWLRGRK